MNYTFLNRLKKNCKKSNEELTKEIFDVANIGVTNSWGFTSAMNDYISCLKKIKMLNRLKLSFLINNYVKHQERKLKKIIKVVFFVNEYSTFPSVKSVYDEMEKDENIICDLVHVPFSHTNKTTDSNKEIDDYINNGYTKIIEGEDYDLAKSSPDIAIYLKPYDSIPAKFFIHEVGEVIDKIVYIAYAINCVNSEELLNYNYKSEMSEKAWLFLSHCTSFKKLADKISNTKGKNYILIGHPRMDLINLDFTNNEWYKLIKEKANGRKIYLYDPHHAINEKHKWGTFKKYGLEILKYFKDNKDLFLIYRPHPLLKGALEKEYKDNSEFFKQYNKLLKSENIFYDDNSDYLISMHISDFLIADANSFIPEFCMYNKPVIYLKYKDGTIIDDKELLSMIYVANSFDDIKKYIMELKTGDLLKEKRMKQIKSYFKFDENKTVATKLIEIIKKEYY